jgi:hypothetical protein
VGSLGQQLFYQVLQVLTEPALPDQVHDALGGEPGQLHPGRLGQELVQPPGGGDLLLVLGDAEHLAAGPGGQRDELELAGNVVPPGAAGLALQVVGGERAAGQRAVVAEGHPGVLPGAVRLVHVAVEQVPLVAHGLGPPAGRGELGAVVARLLAGRVDGRVGDDQGGLHRRPGLAPGGQGHGDGLLGPALQPGHAVPGGDRDAVIPADQLMGAGHVQHAERLALDGLLPVVLDVVVAGHQVSRARVGLEHPGQGADDSMTGARRPLVVEHIPGPGDRGRLAGAGQPDALHEQVEQVGPVRLGARLRRLLGRVDVS